MEDRIEVSEDALKISIDDIRTKTKFRLMEKGTQSFASTHELLGIITEEYQELIEAIKLNNISNIQKEVLDLAVACNFGLACFNQGTLNYKL